MLIAALSPRREDLLSASGQQLRVILAETLYPANIAARLVGQDGNSGEGGEGAKKSALVSWCMEAETLDLSTPESFRHHLALIGEIAEAEHEVSSNMTTKGANATGEVLVIVGLA